MNTKIILILSLLAVIAAITCYCIVNSVKKEKLKRKFYQYRTISVFDKSEEYVKVEFFSQSPVEPYISDDGNSVIISVEMSVQDNNTPANAYVYYKLDKSGAIVDYLSVEDYQNVAGYLIGKDDYISWLIDGDKAKKPFNTIDREHDFSEADFSRLYNNSTIVHYRQFHSQWLKERYLRKVYFFNNGQWQCMDIADHSEEEKYPEKGNSQNERQRMKSQTFPSYFREGQFDELKTENFHPVFFIRDEFTRGHKAWIMGDHSKPSYWSGFGFLHLVLKNETLKLCLWMDEIQENNKSYHFHPSPGLELYHDENVDFYIIQSGKIHFYLIKPVNQ